MLSVISITDIGTGGLLTLFVVFLMVGRLVTKSQLKDVQADRDYWRAAFEKSEEARHEASRQITLLTESTQATKYLMDTLRNMTMGSNQSQISP